MKKNLKHFLEKNRWLKGLPNFLTICNSLCGFAAIINVMQIQSGHFPPEQVFAWSAWLILFAMVFDCTDGFAARILNACSMHGIQMDSLSDMVTFGVAPAVLMVASCAQQVPEFYRRWFPAVWLCAAVYIGCAALRLATYNVHAILEKKSSDKFSGLPSPGAAAALCTVLIFCNHCKFSGVTVWIALPFYGIVLGILMVSRIQYLHFGKWLTTIRRSRIKILFVLLLIAAAVWQFEWTAFLAVNGYVLAGITAALLRVPGLLPERETTGEKS